MPDRYGNPDEPEPDDELTALALTIGCRYCNAQPGQRCTNQTLPTQPPTRIPHISRVTDAEEVPF